MIVHRRPSGSRRRGWGLVLLASLSLGGCKSPTKADDKPDAAPKALPPGLSVDGKARALPHILALGTAGEDSWRVVLAEGPLTCDQLTTAYPKRHDGETKTLDFVLMRPVAASGKPAAWSFYQAYRREPEGVRGLTAGAALLDALTTTEATLEVSGLELALWDRGRDINYLWAGPLLASNCGRVKRPEEDRPQKNIKVRIGELDVPIHGASVHEQAGQRLLRLTRVPHACNSKFTQGYDLVIDIALDGSPPKPKLVSIQGAAFPEQPSTSVKPEQTTFKVDSSLVDGRGPIAVQIDADLDLRGYKTSLKGKLVAQRCLRVAR